MSNSDERRENQTEESVRKDLKDVNSDAETMSENVKLSRKQTPKKLARMAKISWLWSGMVKLGEFSAKLLKIPCVIFHCLVRMLALMGSGILKCGLFIDWMMRRIHQPFRLILGLAAIGKPIGILLLMLFAAVVTAFLYWGVNTYVLNYDHCFKYHKADSVEFLSKTDPDSPNVFKTESFDGGHSYSITINEKDDVCVYHVEKDSDPLFSVKMERKDDSLFLKLFYTDEKSKEQEISWYSTNNIASTNEVLRIQEKNRAIKSPVFPTNTGAFVSWLREYGKDQIPKAKEIANDDWKLLIAGELERHFENEWLFNDKTYWFLIFGRSFNGMIQFFSVVLFVAALMCLYARNILLVCHLTARKDRIGLASGEQLPFAEVEEEDFHNWLQREYNTTVKAQKVFRRVWGCDSSQLFVWEHGLLLFMESDTPHISTLNDIANVQKENLDNSRSFVYWLLDSIPALGFVGTVIGISQTMMNTSSVLSNELGKQQSRISEVSMNLAFAFDTTLIALVLALIASFFMAYCIRRENDALNKTQELLVRILNENS